MSWTYATLLALLAAFLALSRESDAGESSFFRACRVMIAVCIIFFLIIISWRGELGSLDSMCSNLEPSCFVL